MWFDPYRAVNDGLTTQARFFGTVDRYEAQSRRRFLAVACGHLIVWFLPQSLGCDPSSKVAESGRLDDSTEVC